ncbi:histidine phosphatase family protein [Halomonas eurihalina]|nr:histidine phosphatase family protein [Halomonas eurihalina]MDR5858817.1 histidine phosphatase family protein [Halomonas eurihalina]
MTELILIRHGQASFGSSHYDRLSDRGRQQAQALKNHWQRIGWRFDRTISGTLERQLDTAKLASHAPALIVQDNAFDEYCAQTLLHHHGGPPPFETPSPRDARHFHLQLEGALRGWIKASSHTSSPEPWPHFNGRVNDQLHQLARTADVDERLAVFTSAGVIACAVASVLNLGTEGFLALNRRLWNASVTHLAYGRSGFSLLGFNDVGALRLASPELVTYR